MATVNGKRIADTRDAPTLKEAAYPPVQYIPRKDVEMTQLQRTAHQTYCPEIGHPKCEQRAELSGISYINSWKMAPCTPDSRASHCIPAPLSMFGAKAQIAALE
jgi:hypothetical protein